MAKRQYNRTYYYSIGGMLTDEEVHQIWEIVGNALDRNAVSYTHPSPRDTDKSRMPSSA